jgi:transmembrane sensor
MKTSGDPTQEAADWLARLRSDNMSEMEEARFRAWLSGDPARRREFDALSTMWDELDRVADFPEVLAAMSGPKGRIVQPRVSRRAVLGWALAAGVAGAAGFVSWQRWLASGHYETLVGEQRTVPLADGSIITLNTSSRVHVRLGPNERRISLLQGQAQFEVAKDAARPFIVSAGRGEVRALGTTFDVYRRTDDVVVTLIEGRVAVASDTRGEADPTSHRVELAAGEQAAFTHDGANLVRRRADVRRISAWRSRKLDFAETPLSEAIIEANRYSHIKVELRAPALSDARISGVFDAGRNDAFADALRAYFGLQVQRERDDLLVLTQEKT